MTEPEFNPVHAANLEREATAFARSKGIDAVTSIRKFEVREVVKMPGFIGMEAVEAPGFIRFDALPAAGARWTPTI